MRCTSIRHTLMRCMPNEIHADEIHDAYEIHAYEIILVNIISRGLCVL
jgi:hypothetical protein